MVVTVFLNTLQKEIMSEIHTVFKEKYGRYFTISCKQENMGSHSLTEFIPETKTLKNSKETNSNMYNLK